MKPVKLAEVRKHTRQKLTYAEAEKEDEFCAWLGEHYPDHIGVPHMCTDYPLARFIYGQWPSLAAISIETSDRSAATRRGVIFRPLSSGCGSLSRMSIGNTPAGQQ